MTGATVINFSEGNFPFLTVASLIWVVYTCSFSNNAKNHVFKAAKTVCLS